MHVCCTLWSPPPPPKLFHSWFDTSKKILYGTLVIMLCLLSSSQWGVCVCVCVCACVCVRVCVCACVCTCVRAHNEPIFISQSYVHSHPNMNVLLPPSLELVSKSAINWDMSWKKNKKLWTRQFNTWKSSTPNHIPNTSGQGHKVTRDQPAIRPHPTHNMQVYQGFPKL